MASKARGVRDGGQAPQDRQTLVLCREGTSFRLLASLGSGGAGHDVSRVSTLRWDRTVDWMLKRPPGRERAEVPALPKPAFQGIPFHSLSGLPRGRTIPSSQMSTYSGTSVLAANSF